MCQERLIYFMQRVMRIPSYIRTVGKINLDAYNQCLKLLNDLTGKLTGNSLVNFPVKANRKSELTGIYLKFPVQVKPCQIFYFWSNLARSFFSGQPLPDLSIRVKPCQIFLFGSNLSNSFFSVLETFK